MEIFTHTELGEESKPVAGIKPAPAGGKPRKPKNAKHKLLPPRLRSMQMQTRPRRLPLRPRPLLPNAKLPPKPVLPKTLHAPKIWIHAVAQRWPKLKPFAP